MVRVPAAHMKKSARSINITVKRSSVTLQLFDKWYAYRQSIDPDYQSDVSIVYSDHYQPGMLNIWFEYMPRALDPAALSYELVWLCNGGEATAVATPCMRQWLSHDRVYLCADGLVTPGHVLAHKIIWHPHNPLNTHDYWTRSFYPQYFHAYGRAEQSRKPLVGINGSNRFCRHYFWSLLMKDIPELPRLNSYPQLRETSESQWESVADQKFREYLVKTYSADPVHHVDHYYAASIKIGVDQKFGTIPPGYFFLPEYFHYHCVIFPETTWQNDELQITEKGFKCFYAGAVPMPVGGRAVNALYNSLGFATAWNLLPDHMQQFDATEDHQRRYQQLVTVIQWFMDRPDIWRSDHAREITRQNQLRFLTNAVDHIAILKFDKWIQNHLL